MKNARRAQNGSLKNSLIITYLLMMGVLVGIAAILIVRLLWQFTDDEFEAFPATILRSNCRTMWMARC